MDTFWNHMIILHDKINLNFSHGNQEDIFTGVRDGVGAYYWREFYISKWFKLDNTNRLRH